MFYFREEIEFFGYKICHFSARKMHTVSCSVIKRVLQQWTSTTCFSRQSKGTLNQESWIAQPLQEPSPQLHVAAVNISSPVLPTLISRFWHHKFDSYDIHIQYMKINYNNSPKAVLRFMYSVNCTFRFFSVCTWFSSATDSH